MNPGWRHASISTKATHCFGAAKQRKSFAQVVWTTRLFAPACCKTAEEDGPSELRNNLFHSRFGIESRARTWLRFSFGRWIIRALRVRHSKPSGMAAIIQSHGLSSWKD